MAVGLRIVQIGKDMKNQADQLEGRADSLTRDHRDLSKDIKEARDAARCDIARLAETASFLRDAQPREDARREQLQGRQLDAQRVADIVSAQTALVGQQRQELERLRAENAELRKEIGRLHSEKKEGQEQKRT